MITLETSLKKLKHEVLKHVATLEKEGRLSKETLEKACYEVLKSDKPQYRCCIYKERAIVNERAKLAAGYLPDGDNVEDLKPIMEEDQIVYVISAACDQCPIDRFTVTEACRGCIEHKCMEVCPAKSIERVAGRAYINQEICKECGLCKNVCPYNAISEVMRPCKRVCPTGALTVNEEDRRAKINNEDCINCGACMAACPFGAISDKSYIVPVVKALKADKPVYAIVAPAIAGQFGPKVSLSQVKAAFLKLGFEDMLEAACGADAVTVQESQEFIEKMESGQSFMTNSCCPGFMSYIEKKFPQLADKISSTVSPMIATAKLIRQQNSEAAIIFVGPCTAKKSEIKREELKGIVDYVITFEEIAAILDAYNVDPESLEGVITDESSIFGRGFAQGGGLTAAVQNYLSDKDSSLLFNPVRISGMEEIKKTLTMAKVGRLEGNFIEGMMCEGGCIGGPASLLPIRKSKPLNTKFSGDTPIKAVAENKKLKEFKALHLER